MHNLLNRMGVFIKIRKNNLKIVDKNEYKSKKKLHS